MSRPSEFSQEVVNEICERMQAGETLTAICKDDHLPAKNTVLRWLEAHTPFQTQYARARTALMDHYADQMVEIAFEGSNNDQVAVQRDRLKVDTLKWIMSKLGHRKYGDKLTVSPGDDGEPVQQLQRLERVIVDAPDNRLLQRIKELEEQLGIQGREETPQRLLTFDPGPLPSKMHGDIAVRLVGLVKARVPGADQRPPEAVLDELMGVIDRALIAEYGEVA